VFVLFCFKLGKSVAKTKKILKQAFGDDAGPEATSAGNQHRT